MISSGAPVCVVGYVREVRGFVLHLRVGPVVHELVVFPDDGFYFSQRRGQEVECWVFSHFVGSKGNEGKRYLREEWVGFRSPEARAQWMRERVERED